MGEALILASTQRNIGIVLAWLLVVAFIAYIWLNMRSAKPELGNEIELAPNKKPYYDDEDLEGPRLDRFLSSALVLLAIVAVGLPLYWLAEPGRQSGAIENFGETFAGRGEALFEANCSSCHGLGAVGGVTSYILTDPETSEFIAEVEYNVPALNNVLLRYERDEVKWVLDHGRIGPMQAWSTVGGGAMTSQQVDNIIDYLESIQITPDEAKDEVEAGVQEMLDSGRADSVGEALFNLETAGGSYSCARCHTPGWSFARAGATGTGAFGPSLVGSAERFASAAQYEDFISNGTAEGEPYGLQGKGDGGGQMPGFGQMYTPEQIAAVVEYESSLDGTQVYAPRTVEGAESEPALTQEDEG